VLYQNPSAVPSTEHHVSGQAELSARPQVLTRSRSSDPEVRARREHRPGRALQRKRSGGSAAGAAQQDGELLGIPATAGHPRGGAVRDQGWPPGKIPHSHGRDQGRRSSWGRGHPVGFAHRLVTAGPVADGSTAAAGRAGPPAVPKPNGPAPGPGTRCPPRDEHMVTPAEKWPAEAGSHGRAHHGRGSTSDPGFRKVRTQHPTPTRLYTVIRRSDGSTSRVMWERSRAIIRDRPAAYRERIFELELRAGSSRTGRSSPSPGLISRAGRCLMARVNATARHSRRSQPKAGPGSFGPDRALPSRGANRAGGREGKQKLPVVQLPAGPVRTMDWGIPGDHPAQQAPGIWH